jgi:alanyl-tRNA synthetase
MIAATEKIYDADAYEVSFTAKVLSCEKSENEAYKECYDVCLDRTAFFPEEGGQEPDRGTLGGRKILDVQIIKTDNGEVIVHTVDGALEVNSMVDGLIEWNHRFDQMQQHSGEHIFSGITHNLYGYDNVGFHLSTQVVTMDFNGPLTDEQVIDIERRANEVIVSNREIVISWPDSEDLHKMDYRSKKELEGPVRIVTIPGTDVCACCAPHVRRTGEIGFLKVMNRQNYKGGVRVTIECGMRALLTVDAEHRLITGIANDMTTSVSSIPGQIEKMKQENQHLRGELSALRGELMQMQIRMLPEGSRCALLFTGEADNKNMQNAVNELVKKHSGYCGVFSGNNGSYRFIIGIEGGDARLASSALREKFGARGGGSAQMVQGSVNGASEEELRNCLVQLD